MARLARLTVALFLFSSLPLCAAITGHVVDEDGKPLKGARVRTRAIQNVEQFVERLRSKDPQPAWLDTAETNESGVFRVETKSNAVVEMTVDAAGRQFYTQEVADGEDAGTFVLRNSPPRRGRVTAGGKGVANAVVVIGRVYVTRTDAEGYYDAADPGTLFDGLTVLHPDYAVYERFLRMRGVQPAQLATLDVTLNAGTTVRGRVVDGAGRGVAGAEVRAGNFALARSGEDGSFELAHVPDERPPLLTAREGNRIGSLNTEGRKAPFAIALRPAATLTGAVRTKDELPIAGARVAAANTDYSVGPNTFALTDAKGTFTLTGVEGGALRLIASHPAYAGAGTEVRVADGERVNRVVHMEAIARLSGRVVDEEQKPVGGARFSTLGGSAGFNGASAPDGSFSLRIPPAGRPVTLNVYKPGFAYGSFGPYALEQGETKSGVVLRMTRGFRLEVRLTDREGAPIANEPVLVSRSAGDSMSFATRGVPCGPDEFKDICRSGKDGSVGIGIAEGTYDIVAGGEAAVRRDLPGQTLTARSSPLSIVLERGSVIEGRVVWSDGTPANVTGSVSTTSAPRAMTPITDGSFALRNVPAGKVTVVADIMSPLSTRSEPVEFTAPATGVTLKIARAGRLEGRVVDRDTSKAVRDFVIQLEAPAGMNRRWIPPRPFRTEDGRFTLEDVAPGSYDVRAQAVGFVLNNATPVTIEEGKTATANVQLDRGGAVRGRVTSNGQPVPDVFVVPAYTRELGMIMTSTQTIRTDANGEFLVDGLPAGTHRLEFRGNGMAPKTVSAAVTPPDETRLDVELERARELRGRVVDFSGKPVAQAEVSPRVSSFSGSNMAMTDGEGNFRLTGLGDSSYVISAHKEGFVDGTVTVNPASAADVTITLGRGGTISGRILGVGPDELPYVEVHAFSVRSRGRPDANGAYTLTGVPDGETTVLATLSRPRRRETHARVTVVNGSAPPVDLDFNAGIAVRGRVTLLGKPVQGFLSLNPVSRQRDQQPSSSEVGADGLYEVRLAAPGEYQINVMRMGMRGPVNCGNVTVTGDMTHDIELRGATLTGRVVDATTGEPVPGASVILLPGNDTQARGGRFTFDLLQDGDYRLRGQAPGYAPTTRSVTIANGSAPETDLALARGIDVQYRVTDLATGQPVEINRVSVMDSAKFPVFVGDAPLDALGVYHLTLQPGTYELRLFASEYVSKPVTLTVPGPPLEVKVERLKH